jgi:hypothetical protein
LPATARSIVQLPREREMFKELTVPKMQLSLWYSLITLKRTWIDTVLDSADYHQLFKFETNRFARELRAFNYNYLLPLWDNDQTKVDLQKAASFDSHARVQLANAFSPGDERHHCVKSVRSGSRLHCWKFLTGKGCCTRCPVSRTRLLRELPSLMKTFLPSKFLLTNFQNIEIA